jgi:hypothetical protein
MVNLSETRVERGNQPIAAENFEKLRDSTRRSARRRGSRPIAFFAPRAGQNALGDLYSAGGGCVSVP